VLLVEYSQLKVIPVIVVELAVFNTKLEPVQIVVVPFVPSVNSMIGLEGRGVTVMVLAVMLDVELQLEEP
tara:strand:- start:139 stop:348 length:210 start_codon:yes stop_codon:yes gene_type:complete